VTPDLFLHQRSTHFINNLDVVHRRIAQTDLQNDTEHSLNILNGTSWEQRTGNVACSCQQMGIVIPMSPYSSPNANSM
jgi:hypothetical protein